MAAHPTNHLKFETGVVGIYFILAVAEIFGLLNMISLDQGVISLLSQILFLNVFHVGFTFSFLFSTRKGKAWLTDVVGWSRRQAIVLNLSAFVLLSSLIAGVFYVFIDHSTPHGIQWMLTFQLFLLVILPTQHRLGQSFGILGGRDLHIDPLIYRRMHTLKGPLLGLSILGLTLHYLEPSLSINQTFLLNVRLLTTVSVSIMAITLVFLVRKNFKALLFSLRFGLWPLALVTPSASFGLIAIHGLEYFKIYRRLVDIEDKTAHGMSLALGALLLACFFIRPIGGGSFNLFETHPLLVSVVAGISYGLSLMHFFWDRYIFRMRNPRIRELIGSSF